MVKAIIAAAGTHESGSLDRRAAVRPGIRVGVDIIVNKMLGELTVLPMILLNWPSRRLGLSVVDNDHDMRQRYANLSRKREVI